LCEELYVARQRNIASEEEIEIASHLAEIGIIRLICGVKLKEKIS